MCDYSNQINLTGNIMKNQAFIPQPQNNIGLNTYSQKSINEVQHKQFDMANKLSFTPVVNHNRFSQTTPPLDHLTFALAVWSGAMAMLACLVLLSHLMP
jgi:hypothetical protein